MDRIEATVLGDQLLDLVRRGQETALDAGRILSDRVAAVLPVEPDKADELLDTAFDLGERILRGQRAIAREVVDVIVAKIPDDTDR